MQTALLIYFLLLLTGLSFMAWPFIIPAAAFVALSIPFKSWRTA